MIIPAKWFVFLPALTFILVATMGADKCPKNPCDSHRCAPGEHCEVQPTLPPTAICVPDVIPSPSPLPSPTPIPTPTPVPTPSPSTSPSPLPSPTDCPVECADDADASFWMGVALRSKVTVKKQDGKYLGWRYNFDATPHTKLEACQDRPGASTEQRKDCQNPNGPDFYMTLPGHFFNDPCDKFSFEAYWCHHKPEGPNGASGKGAQVGPTTVCAVPEGDDPQSARGRCVTVNIQP